MKTIKMRLKPELLKTASITAAASFVLAALVIALFAVTASTSALVQERGKGWYRARDMVIAGDTMICMRDTACHASRRLALRIPVKKYRFSMMSMRDVAFIEVIPPRDKDTGTVPAQYLGSYRIVASAHRGYLKLWAFKGRIYGSIRFPEWANGVVEPLKGVVISPEGAIRFTRSVTTRKEQVRVGSSSYFTQRYYGRYYRNGKTIRGYYTRNGPRGMWEATKFR